jgi:hypothetical protein
MVPKPHRVFKGRRRSAIASAIKHLDQVIGANDRNPAVPILTADQRTSVVTTRNTLALAMALKQ